MSDFINTNWQKRSADHQKQYKQWLQRADKNKVLKQLPDAHEAAFENINCRFGDIVAVCDVHQQQAEAAAKLLTKDGKTPTIFNDFRKVMERDDIQVIVQATPDHWHTLINLAAAKAKKDVYGEKPLTLTIDDGSPTRLPAT